MLVLEYDELYARLLATRSVQERIASEWTWEEKTVAQWDTLKTGLEGVKAALDGAEAAEALSVGALEKASMTLHDATKQALGLAKVRFRKTPETLKAFTGLQASKSSLAAIKRSGDDFAAAWQKADSAGSYAGVSLASYNATRSALTSAESARSAAKAATKQAKQRFRTQKEAVYQDLIAWYAAATRVFPDSTETGALVRTQIPT
ncbi:hypothetical protein [Armatimonas sp.]|uniref:hypothetical protein n=1 Tax=Armatimonas sp. TaxID=1872638 RepID=UPI0037503AF2